MFWTVDAMLVLVRTVKEMDKERLLSGKATRSWREIAKRLPNEMFGEVHSQKQLASISKFQFFHMKKQWALQNSRSPRPSIFDQIYEEFDKLYIETDDQTNSYMSEGSFSEIQDRKARRGKTVSSSEQQNGIGKLESSLQESLDRKPRSISEQDLNNEELGIEKQESSLQESLDRKPRSISEEDLNNEERDPVQPRKRGSSSERPKRKRGYYARDEHELKGDFRGDERNDLDEPRSFGNQCVSPSESASEWQGSQSQDADRQTDWKLETRNMLDSQFNCFSSWTNRLLICAGREVHHRLSAEKFLKTGTLSNYGEFTRRCAHSRTSSAVQVHFQDLRLRITKELDKTIDRVLGETGTFFREY